jgi:hypothetical protein
MRLLPWLPILLVLSACNFPKEAETQPGDEDRGGAAVPESTHATRGPDGTAGWLSISCGNSAECYRRAGITCPMGFSVYDRDKSTAYAISGSARSATIAGGGPGFAASATMTEVSGVALPIEHNQLLVKCGSSEKNDQKLMDQLKAYCDDGNAKACAALDLATKKRGCCSWHQGVRSCNDAHRVVCFDSTEPAGDNCGC